MLIHRFVKYDISMLTGSLLHDELVQVLDFYDSIAGDFSAFEDEFGLHCPPRCGNCCACFVPELCHGEALAIAWTLLENGVDVDWHAGDGACPLFDGVHRRCRAYGVRPVICRCFFSSAVRGKDGLAFNGCRLSNQPGAMIHSLGKEALESASSPVPVMSDYGERVRSLSGYEWESLPMDEYVPRLMEQLRYTVSLLSGPVAG